MGKGCLIFIPGINSVTHKERLTTYYDFPRGGLSLASFLASRGKKVSIVPLDYYVPPSNNPAKVSSALRHVVQSAVRELDPALIGIGVSYTMMYPTALCIASFCKEVSEAVVCLGGPHVSYTDRQVFIDSKCVDVVVRGEGEWALLELLEKVEGGEDFSDVLGTTVRNTEPGAGNAGLAKVNPPRPQGDMSELPVLKYDLLPEGFVKNMLVTIVGSRGCAYKCAYCLESEFWGHKVRVISVDNIIEEARILSERYDNPPLAFEDSMFNMRSPRFFELCDRLKDIRLHHDFYMLARVDSVTDEGFRAMKAAGINKICLGIENASPKVLATMNKKITYEKSEDTCRMAVNAGVKVGSFWIIGHPGDSMKEARITLNALNKLYSLGYIIASEIAMFIPYPGTTIFKNPEEYGIDILNYNWERWGRFNTEPVCQLKEFKKEDIIKCWLEAQQIAKYWTLKAQRGV